MKNETTNTFLENQRRVMAQREAMRLEREAERAAGTENQTGWAKDVLADTPKRELPSDAARTDRPLPQRIVKPKLLSFDDLRQEVDRVGNEIQDAIDAY